MKTGFTHSDAYKETGMQDKRNKGPDYQMCPISLLLTLCTSCPPGVLLPYIIDFLVYQGFNTSWNHYSEFKHKKVGFTVSWPACVQDAADHAWHHHEEHGQQLQVPTHDAGGLHVRHVLARQAALHDDLPGIWHSHETIRGWLQKRGSVSFQGLMNITIRNGATTRGK